VEVFDEEGIFKAMVIFKVVEVFKEWGIFKAVVIFQAG
jgi:hypothetical protein